MARSRLACNGATDGFARYVSGPTDGQSEREGVSERQTKLKRLHDTNLNLDNSLGRMRCEALVARIHRKYALSARAERSDIIVKNYIKIISRKRRSRLELNGGAAALYVTTPTGARRGASIACLFSAFMLSRRAAPKRSALDGRGSPATRWTSYARWAPFTAAQQPSADFLLRPPLDLTHLFDRDGDCVVRKLRPRRHSADTVSAVPIIHSAATFGNGKWAN